MINYIRKTAVSPSISTQIRRDFGALVDPFALHAPVPDLLAGAWMAAREAEICGHVPRPLKEAVATAVSELNQCSYCTDAHTIMLQATNADRATLEMRQITAWAEATRSPDAPILQAPPFAKEDVAEIVGTAVLYHYINRMADIFLDDSPLPAHRSRFKGFFTQMAGWYFSWSARRSKTAGESLHFLPEAQLPDDMAWASASPIIADAFGRWAAVIQSAGQHTLSEPVRTLVQQHIADWRGETMPLSRHWVETAVAPLSKIDQPAACLALLSAFAPFQVDEKIITSFRTTHPEDAQLIAATAWASFAVARRIGGWLSVECGE